MNRNVLSLGLLHELRKLPICSLNDKALERSAAGAQGFTNGMQPIQQFRPAIASSGWCRPVCLR